MKSLYDRIIENNKFFLNGQKKLINVFFVSQLFFLISIGSIGSLSLSIPFVIGVIYFIFSVVGFLTNSIIIEKKSLIYYLIFTILIFVCSIFSNYELNIKSFLLIEYYFSFYLLLDCRHKNSDFYRILKMFIIICSIFNCYSIYQFLAYNFIKDLPFKELISEVFWTKDYNVIQSTRYNELQGIIKPHSIYAEASFLSRYSGINLLLLFSMRKQMNKTSLIILSIINFISLIISLSGSGIIIVLCGLVYLIIYSKKRVQLIFVVFIGIFLLIIIGNNNVLNYFYYRLKELQFSDNYNSSGYYRFILPIKIGIDNLSNNFLGYGIGNDNIAFSLYNAAETNISNGFGKLFVECGVVGLTLLLIFFKLIKPKNKKEETINILFLILFICNIVSTLMEITFWCTALFLSANIKSKRKGEV